MGRIYPFNHVQRKIDEIAVEGDSNSKAVSFTETLCSPKYRTATYVGAFLAAL